MNLNNEYNDKYFHEFKKKEKEYDALREDQISLITKDFTEEIELKENQLLDNLKLENHLLKKEKEEIIQSKDDQLKLKESQLLDKENQINDLINQLADKENKLKDIKNRKKKIFNLIKRISNQLIDKTTVKDDQIIQIYRLINQIKKYYYNDKYSEEEKEKRDKMIFSNQLIQNQNLISHFGSEGSDPFTHFNNPLYITYNDKLNIIAVSDYHNNRVKIMDKKGALIQCFPFQLPKGIAIIPSLSLLAVSYYTKHVIEIFDISPLLPTIHKNNNNNHHL